MHKHKYCPICGGLTNQHTITRRLPSANSEGIPYPLASVPPVNICVGHPESTPKHDGNLGEHSVDYRYGDVEIDKILNDLDHSVRVCLSPKEALSLLAWLTQEREELERLAKEQEG